MPQKSYYKLTLSEAIEAVETSRQGLSNKEAKRRLEKHGPNQLPKKRPLSNLKIILEQFKSPLIYILVIAGFVTLGLGEYTDSIVIFGAVLVNTVVGYIQEKKASQALQALKQALTVEAIVRRDGRKEEIEQEEVVCGDIIILRSGDKVPADARLIAADNLKINESALTGEWWPAKKKTDPLEASTPLADRDNMVYMGTSIEDGEGQAVVVATGTDTEIGKIAAMLRKEEKEQTPYQRKLAHFSKVIGVIIGLISIAIFIEGLVVSGKMLEMFETAIAIAVAAIPEGLPVAMTVILALGMQRILKRKGLVRRLVSAETLGSTSIICTDKTGTLTEAKMSVAALYNSQGGKVEQGDQLFEDILTTGLVCNEAFIENPTASPYEWVLRGSPTEKAIVAYGKTKGMVQEDILEQNPQVKRIIFSSAYKYSASLNRISEKKRSLFVMGAPEVLLEASSAWQDGSEKKKLTEKKSEAIKKTNNKLTGQGLRVLACARRKLSAEEAQGRLKDKVARLTFLGFITIHDPIREEVKEAIATCKKAGMRPIIVTGDHKLTARAVAEKLNFKVAEDEIIEGRELSRFSEEEFQRDFKKYRIYARVEPEQKLRIIEAWQDADEVVAMTGDGVNDAPAVKKADVGVALGSGTDVTKEVSDLVLLTDNFSVIVAAVEEGRAILSNIRKVVTYLLSDSFTEIILIGVSIIAGWPLPLLPVQILWVNLVEDGLPNMALAFEPKEKGLMKQKPQPLDVPLLTQ